MKKSTEIKLRKLVERIIKEEEGRTYAKPVVKKGEKVKVKSLYDGKFREVVATTNSEFDSGEFWFQCEGSDGEPGIFCNYNRKAGYWEIDPVYQSYI